MRGRANILKSTRKFSVLTNFAETDSNASYPKKVLAFASPFHHAQQRPEFFPYINICPIHLSKHLIERHLFRDIHPTLVYRSRDHPFQQSCSELYSPKRHSLLLGHCRGRRCRKHPLRELSEAMWEASQFRNENIMKKICSIFRSTK
jgi:hypothetical protein